MRGAQKAAAYNQWLVNEIQASIDDSRPSISHHDVMAEMDADIAGMAVRGRNDQIAATGGDGLLN